MITFISVLNDIFSYLNDIGLLPIRGIKAELAQTYSAGGIIAAVWG
jgi:hypothetical protein